MKTFQSVVPLFGLVAAAQAWGTGWNDTVWTTVTTDIYTTYCPDSTTFTYGTKTYTATASEYITITDCPCTYSKPIKSTPTPSTSSLPVVPINSTWVPPVWITTTETVSEYTTYCPAPTSVVQGNQTYTVTEATTLTITNCPCTKTQTLPGTTSVITIGTTTSYCPTPTVVTSGSSTIVVSTPTSVTLPILSTTTYAISTTPASVAPVSSVATTPASVAPVSSVVTTPAGPVTTPVPAASSSGNVGPSPTTSLPLQVTGAAALNQLGLGAIAAGLAAMIL